MNMSLKDHFTFSFECFKNKIAMQLQDVIYFHLYSASKKLIFKETPNIRVCIHTCYIF